VLHRNKGRNALSLKRVKLLLALSHIYPHTLMLPSMQLLTETVFTPRWVSQVFEVGGDRNQIRLNLQVHLSVQVGLDYLMKTHTNATLHPTN